MKTGHDIQALAKLIADRAERKEDIIADTRDMAYDVSTNSLVLPGDNALVVNDHAHSQIAAHADIPAAYYKRMREQTPALLEKSIRAWFDHAPARRMVRTMRAGDGQERPIARAFLSDKFSRMDDDRFASTVLPAIFDVPGARVMSSGLTDTKTTIKFVSPRLERQVKVGDTVQFGVAYSNSEVGCGRLTGSLFAYQLRCTNGMCIEEEMFASTHVGKRVGQMRDLGEVFKLDTLAADGEATILKLRDITKELLSDRFLDVQVEKMRDMTKTELKNPAKAVEVLAKQHSFASDLQAEILKHLMKTGEPTIWGLQNAVTRAAEDRADYDEATRLETIGGRMLTLARKDYQQLAEAA